ncbi:MAG: laccase domain protein [Candidatus Tectimicrobiota bacterium]|nr:MAG: laccase domain protein [Candidatus Tectomicrobia bacterium]
MFGWRATDGVLWLEPLLEAALPVRCAFTTRWAGQAGGPLNLGLAQGRRDEVLANRARVLRALGLAEAPLVTVRQVHGKRVCVVDERALRRGVAATPADALVTALPGVVLGVLVADCLPVVLYSLAPAVVAVVHAGRKGTEKGVVLSALATLQRRFGLAPAQVFALLGPAIGPCCYVLDERAVAPFRRQGEAWRQFFCRCRDGQWAMDLVAANTLQLRQGGVPAGHIQALRLCTVCNQRYFFSYRAEGRAAGRGMALAVLRLA